MTKDVSDSGRGESRSTQKDARAAALKANLARRKQQSMARRGGKAIGRSEPSAFDKQDKPVGE